MIDILIDRVGNINVFNILNSGQYYSEANIQSAIDSDLISEYIKEIINLSKLSNQISGNQKKNLEIKPEILQDLKNISETFYEQFFPESISNKLKTTQEKFLHFSIDNSLSDIPWELLYDGECFLSDRFYIGRTVKGSKANTVSNLSTNLKMLIIADPTEDLEWAQKEGELVFRTLKEKISPSKLHLEFIAGKQITKLKLLSLIRDKHIIHYAGHLFFSVDPLENGWLLSDDKILKAREIKNSAFSTNLIFSNSCNSSKAANLKINNSDSIHDFASSFLLSGIKNFIGTKWEVVDNDKTIDFSIRFYLNLFSDKTIGESLNIAREYARKNYGVIDLTWANYSQYGNPTDTISKKQNQSKTKIINPDEIKKNYPTPIAYSYAKFMDLS
jgi:CHAT domain-containing protein